MHGPKGLKSHIAVNGTSLLTFQETDKSLHSVILAHTCNRAKGIIFFCSPLCLDRRQGIVTAHVCRKYSITPSMKHFKTTAVTLPYLPELALMFQRWQEGHMALSKGNISRCVLHDRKPADGIVAFWNF